VFAFFEYIFTVNYTFIVVLHVTFTLYKIFLPEEHASNLLIIHSISTRYFLSCRDFCI